MKEKSIPILNHFEKEKIFFETTVDWKPPFPRLHEHFHINRLEDVVTHLKFPFPPHRQTVSDFVFITRGKSTRSKGLDTYDFSINTFFFLPAYQISTHDFMSQNVKGFYCHFDIEVFNRKFINQNIFSGFSFLQFTGNPLVTVNNSAKLHILYLLNRLEQEYSGSIKINPDIVSITLLALLLEVKQFSKQEKITENAAFRIAQQYKNKLSQYIYEKHSVTEYAGLLNVSQSFKQMCKSCYR